MTESERLYATVCFGTSQSGYYSTSHGPVCVRELTRLTAIRHTVSHLFVTAITNSLAVRRQIRYRYDWSIIRLIMSFRPEPFQRLSLSLSLYIYIYIYIYMPITIVKCQWHRQVSHMCYHYRPRPIVCRADTKQLVAPPHVIGRRIHPPPSLACQIIHGGLALWPDGLNAEGRTLWERETTRYKTARRPSAVSTAMTWSPTRFDGHAERDTDNADETESADDNSMDQDSCSYRGDHASRLPYYWPVTRVDHNE